MNTIAHHLHQLAVAAPDNVPKVPINNTTVGGVVGGVLMLAAAVCVVFIVIGAISYTLSLGDASKIKKAKDSILYAVVGLVIVGLAFLIIQFVIGIF